MKTMIPLSVVGLGVLLAVGMLLSGCEDEGTVALTVDPSYVDMSDPSNTNYSTSGSSSNSASTPATQTFTVTAGTRQLSLPLEWSVSNPELGYIAAAGGYSASYVRSGGIGDNAIRVRDQYGAEGVATVHQ
mgnify:CR=1 FL=1